ncbi:MAG: hypothetical protein V1702_00980 [Candidatus Woesearchaeota archaeon]
MNAATIMKELDPKYDLSRHIHDDSIGGGFKDLGVLALNLGKSFVRGASVGALVGTASGLVYGIVSGDVPKGTIEGLRNGTALGLVVDISQYGIRYAVSKLRNDVSK